MCDFVIFGAKSIALGVCLAMQKLYKDCSMVGFLVSNKDENPTTLAGLPVFELDTFSQKDVCILIATPEDIHTDIVKRLEEKGFHNYICIDSRKESDLMERYYGEIGMFQSVHTL